MDAKLSNKPLEFSYSVTGLVAEVRLLMMKSLARKKAPQITSQTQ